MRSVLLLLYVLGGVWAQAVETVDNPVGVVYKASLPEKPFFADADLKGNVEGSITAQTPGDGKGVKFTVSFKNFPKSGGPFTYHLHANPAVDGNCTSTIGHLDPFNVTDAHVCDPDAPADCQVGDLSGKHGKITTDPFAAEYTDAYASTRQDSDAFFGDKSFVIHYANKTRLTCANFVRLGGGKPNATGAAPTATGFGPVSHAPAVGGSLALALAVLGAVVAF